MSIRNVDVIYAWYRGGRLSTAHLRTDGARLYSYRLLIGERLDDGRLCLYDYTPGGLGFVSKTTSRHVYMAREYADIVIRRREDYERMKGMTPHDVVRSEN